MPYRTPAVIKSTLETGDRPTEAQFADFVDSVHTEVIPVGNFASFDGVTDDSADIQAVINGSNPGDTLIFPPRTAIVENLEFLGHRKYVGYGTADGLFGTTLKLKAGSTGHIFVSDRWNQSAVELGRPVVISGIIFDGNKANAPSGGHAIILANYRGVVEWCPFINMTAAGDCIHMPDTYKDLTPYVQETVNTRIENCWFRGSCEGHSVYAGPQTGETTFSDGWMLNCLDRSLKSVTIYPSSGWLIQGNHPSNNTNGWKFYSGRGLILTDNYLDTITAVEPRVLVEDIGERPTIISDNYGNVGNADVIFDLKGNATDRCVAIVSTNVFSDTPVNDAVITRLTTGGDSIYVYLDNNDINFVERAIRKGGSNGADQHIRDAGNNSWNYLAAEPASITNGRRYAGQWWRNTDFASPRRNIFGWVNVADGNPGTNRAIPCFNDILPGGNTWNAPSIPVGGTASRTFTVTGAAIDNAVLLFPPVDLQGLQHSAYVDAVDSVTIVLNNNTAGAIDLASDFWNVLVFKR